LHLTKARIATASLKTRVVFEHPRDGDPNAHY
jgi:hypothetical protein